MLCLPLMTCNDPAPLETRICGVSVGCDCERYFRVQRKLAPEMGEEPEEQRKSKAEEEAGGDREIESGVLTAVEDIAGEFSKAKGESAVEIQHRASDDHHGAKQHQESAEIARWIHSWIVLEIFR
jgi:hypothetical protein